MGVLEGARVVVTNERRGQLLLADFDAMTLRVLVDDLKAVEEVAIADDGSIFISDDLELSVLRARPAVGSPQPPSPSVASGDFAYDVATEEFTTADGLASPEGLGIDSKGNLWIADEKVPAIFKVEAGSRTLRMVANTTHGEIYSPEGMAVGLDDTVYITDDKKGGVIQIRDDQPSRLLHKIDVEQPEGIAIDPRTGDIWLTSNNDKLARPTVQRWRRSEDGTTADLLEIIQVDDVPPGALNGLVVLADGRVIFALNYKHSDGSGNKTDEIRIMTRQG